MPTTNDHLAEAALQDELAEAATGAETKDLVQNPGGHCTGEGGGGSMAGELKFRPTRREVIQIRVYAECVETSMRRVHKSKSAPIRGSHKVWANHYSRQAFALSARIAARSKTAQGEEK